MGIFLENAKLFFFSVISKLENMRTSTFCKIDCQACCNFSFILRSFLLERRKLPLCELQLILWLEKTLQHVITKKELTLKKNCRRRWVWCVLDINENLCCHWNIKHNFIAIPSKMLKKSAEGKVSTLKEKKLSTEPLMITPSQNN